MSITLGVDLGKTVCSLVGLDTAGKVVMRKRLRRAGLVAFVLNLDRCVVAMEACCGAHHGDVPTDGVARHGPRAYQRAELVSRAAPQAG